MTPHSDGTLPGDSAVAIAVFGDFHGHLRLALQLCRLWQRANGRHLDGVLQCGDFGYFPDESRLDKATRRYAKVDPEELGFARYFGPPAPHERDDLVERTLQGPSDSLDTLRCPIHWCRGNHEDFDRLDETVGDAAVAAVDVYGRFLHVRCGTVVDIAGLLVGFLGGGPGEPSSHRGVVDGRAARRLADERFDVLVSHCAGAAVLSTHRTESGSPDVDTVVRAVRPAWHFFAHYRGPIPPFSAGPTECRWLDDVKFDDEGGLEPGCMGLLWRWPDPVPSLRYVVVVPSWLREVRSTTWRYL